MPGENQGNDTAGARTLSTPPSLSMPKGGGAIRGIGEKFAANPVMGTGSLSVPLPITAGRAGFGPTLSLAYASGEGNGPFGFGWHLALASITRKTDKGLPRYLDAEESDVFVLSGAEDLVPVTSEDGTRKAEARSSDGADYVVHFYRPRVEGLFARIERWTRRADGDIHWRSLSRENVATLYGKTSESRVANPADPRQVYTWLICESCDDKGNAIVYGYRAEDSEGVDTSLTHEKNRGALSRSPARYLKRIRYGNRVSRLVQADLTLADWLFEVVFDYGEHDAANPTPNDTSPWHCRHDPFSQYRAGFEVRTYRLCQRVLMFHHFPGEADVGRDCLVRSADFEYRDIRGNPADRSRGHPVASFVAAVTQRGYKRSGPNAYLRRAYPPLELEYSQVEIDETLRELDAKSRQNLPVGQDGARYQWVDLDGEGASGILTEQAGALFYKPNRGNGVFGPIGAVAQKPSLVALAGGRQHLVDLSGDGQLDLAEFGGGTPGFYERTGDERWEPFKPFASLPNIPWDEPNLRFVDLNGDGHADLLLSEHEAFTWHPSLAEGGFGPARRVRQPENEEAGPRLIFADGTQSIYLADMSGDGLTDLVRIRNGEVCYWPNVGYARFGAKITMDGSPLFDDQDQFSQQRVRLADIDGSGNTDIIYLGRDGARLYFNQSGNSWSLPRRLREFPPVDNLAAVSTVDLLGNGTACLVWSSPLPGDAGSPVRYVDLMGGQKPHLLIQASNNLGAEYHFHYAASTKFYLEDKRNGKPWISRLPFPVHVVERVETFDRIGRHRLVNHFAYHHGYFDGHEREFRGFGMVEQWDTEEFAALASRGALSGAGDDASHVPPIYTRTWFHSGVHLGREHVSNFFAGQLDARDTGEYFREPGQDDAAASRQLLPDTVMPAGLTPEEEREACRALKGTMLRQETYALDGTAKESIPYTVTEQNFTLRRVQPRGGNRHAVFFTHPHEALRYHYERNPADPRVTHALTLLVDEFGNVLKEAAVAYGRRAPDPRLTPPDQAQQARIVATCSEDGVTNGVDAPDAYRTPLPFEGRTFEITGFALAPGANRFTFAEVAAAASGAAVIAYEQQPSPGILQKRLVEHDRALFRRDDLGGALPLGQLQSMALPFETYKLALTPGLVTAVFGDRVTDAMLETEGRYVHSEGEPAWWVASGRVFLSPNRSDTAAEELSHAREHFFLPRRFRDPFDTDAMPTESVVTYDRYDLLVVATRDAAGSVTGVETRDDSGAIAIRNDYRVLQPYWMTDPNGNRARVAFDALGMVVGTAVMGKPPPSPIEGDSLDGFDADPSDAVIVAHLADPLADPHALLQRATSRMLYDLFAYRRTKGQADPQPAVVVSLSRETHASDPVPPGGLLIQQSFSYSDGFGREIQKKTRAEPGPVPQRDAAGAIVVEADGQPRLTATAVNPRWTGSGWTVLNNKQLPVRQFEPFFTDRHGFEFDVRIGISPVLFYDPAGRVVGMLQPNHAWAKVVFDPWRQESWDVNDTVLIADPRTDPDVGDFFARMDEAAYLPTWFTQRSSGALGDDERTGAERTAIHAATPTVAHADSLGRTFLSIAHNRFKRRSDDPTVPPTEEFHAARTVRDIEGNECEVLDAGSRVVMRYAYDVQGKRILQTSMDAGTRWMLDDAEGEALYAWNERGHRFRTACDALRRPTAFFLRDGQGAEILAGRSVFGETLPDAEARNQRGRMVQHFDQAGVVSSDAYDFKGNLLASTQRLVSDYKSTIDWSASPALQPGAFVASTTYDAVNRARSVITPDQSILRPTFNEASLLETLAVNVRGATAATPFVTGIAYDARGKRTRIQYGNGASTAYAYDPLTLRLMSLATTRSADQAILQDFRYTYDAAGNVTRIVDRAQQAIYFDNQLVLPDCDYVYDAVYRLIEASGREHVGQASQSETTADDRFRLHLPQPGDGNAMRRYAEEYRYDSVGNLLQLLHEATNGNWTREFAYKEPSAIDANTRSNRLSSSVVGTHSPELYSYDAHGNMTSMPHLTVMRWDFKDQLSATSRQSVSAGTPETTFYVYDASGQRARKVTERQNGTRKSERIYFGGFEVYREYDGSGTSVTLERECLHVMDNRDRIAMVETKTRDSASPALSPVSRLRYQFANHLGSTALELDGAAQIISYEEFHPYGSTSYQAEQIAAEVSAKRYRYTGLERDDESGLGYHGARYYAPWLARWTRPDPLGIDDGVNDYRSFHDSPIVYRDLNGRNNSALDFVEHAENVQQGLERIRQLGVNSDGREYGLGEDPKTKRLLVIRGTAGGVNFFELKPLGHTHTGLDARHAPSTSDLNELASKNVKETWIYGRDDGWIRLRYDPATKSFAALAQRGGKIASYTIFTNPSFNPHGESPGNQGQRWKTGAPVVQGTGRVHPGMSSKPPPTPPARGSGRGSGSGSGSGSSGGIGGGIRTASLTLGLLTTAVNSNSAKEAAGNVALTVAAMRTRIPQLMLVTAKDEGEAGFGILLIYAATKFPLTAFLIGAGAAVYKGGMWLKPDSMHTPSLGADQTWAKSWAEGGTKSGCGTCHESVRMDNAYKTNDVLRSWERVNGPASRNGIVTDQAREFALRNGL